MSKTDLSTEALLVRREMAEKATPGPWRRHPGRSLVVSMTSEDEPIICDARKAADSAHIAANSPDVVIATIDELLRLREDNERLKEGLENLLRFAECQICYHESTHRGGSIWTICDDCGAKWADDEGGKPKFKEPNEIVNARKALAAARGAVEE